MNIALFLSLCIFFPALSQFFSGDDWFHLRITQIDSFREFLNFFSFSHTAQSAAFYRPLPTQVFFFVFQKLFGLTAWPYHLFVLICFGYSLYLVNRFAQSQFEDKKKSLLTAFVYGISVSNFTRIYFLSAFQEIALVIFSLLCLLSFEKSKHKSLIFFILALLSKETAIVLPLLLLIFNFKIIKKQVFLMVPIIIVSIVYLYFRLGVFGMVSGDSYTWNFSPSKLANTLMWYILWSFGAPELLVDYVGSGLRLVPKFFADYSTWWKIIISLLLGTLSSIGIIVVQRIKELKIYLIRYISFFLIAILPVLFLPSHKFALELGLPLVGFSLAIVLLLSGHKKIFTTIFLSFYITLNLSMNYLTYTRHYSVNRGEISRKVFNYFSNTFPNHPQEQFFEFVNDAEDYGVEWGQSKQISQTLSGSDFFKVFYRSPGLKVYYQDIQEKRPSSPGKLPIYISTKQFLN